MTRLWVLILEDADDNDDVLCLQVGWLKAGDQTILALHKRVITHNSRVSVSHEDNKVESVY